MKKMRRMPRVAAAALAALLLAGPAHAGGPAPFDPSTAFERVWQWWEGLWAGATHSGTEHATQASPRTEKSGIGINPPPEKGAGIDPDGSTATPACQVNCERGGGIDPDG